MKLSQIILEEYQGKLGIYLEAKKNYREVYELDPDEINELLHFDTIAKQQERFLPTLTQAYKDALYMEGELEKAKSYSMPREVLLDGMTISELDVSVRLSNVLRMAEINTLGEVYKMKKADFLKVKNVGRKNLKELEAVFIDLGFNDWK